MCHSLLPMCPSFPLKARFLLAPAKKVIGRFLLYVVGCHTLCYQLSPRLSSILSWRHLHTLLYPHFPFQSSSSSHLVFWWRWVVRQFWCDDSGTAIISISELFIFPVCDLRWLPAMETGLCGPQNTALLKSPCLSTSLTCWACVGGWFVQKKCVWVDGGGERICMHTHTELFDELRLNLCLKWCIWHYQLKIHSQHVCACVCLCVSIWHAQTHT